MRRRGLLRGAARTAGRTAVIAGTATAVSGRVARRQEQAHAREQVTAHQTNAGSGPPSASGTGDIVEQLRHLANLRASGGLSEREFAAAKSKVLG